MEACLREPLPPTTELEENLRNGIYLAKLGHFIAPHVLPLNKIYDSEQRRYKVVGLQFRHTDNINHFLKCLKLMKLPLVCICVCFYAVKCFLYKKIYIVYVHILLKLIHLLI